MTTPLELIKDQGPEGDTATWGEPFRSSWAMVTSAWWRSILVQNSTVELSNSYAEIPIALELRFCETPRAVETRRPSALEKIAVGRGSFFQGG